MTMLNAVNMPGVSARVVKNVKRGDWLRIAAITELGENNGAAFNWLKRVASVLYREEATNQWVFQIEERDHMEAIDAGWFDGQLGLGAPSAPLPPKAIDHYAADALF